MLLLLFPFQILCIEALTVSLLQTAHVQDILLWWNRLLMAQKKFYVMLLFACMVDGSQAQNQTAIGVLIA